jgi:hypothetical protein
MTKMQIIAKAILACLGIYIVTTLSETITKSAFTGSDSSALVVAINLAGITVFITVIAFFLIFKNDALACKIPGPGEKLGSKLGPIWLIGSLRVGLVFLGLVLLTSSIPGILNVAFRLSPPNIRLWLTNAIASKNTFDLIDLSSQKQLTFVYDSLNLVLIIYLLCGAPHLICWQLKHSMILQQPQETQNPNDYSERPENE